jgi:hypothetical protein
VRHPECSSVAQMEKTGRGRCQPASIRGCQVRSYLGFTATRSGVELAPFTLG